jgi:predicted transposase/invertase (TIGR01784 family)
MTTYVDPKNDLAFKKIFGDPSRKSPLINFLNAALNYTGPREIVDLTITNPYQAPRIAGLKNSLLDIKARERTGREFIVEVQVERDMDFGKRAMYYGAKSYAGQIKKAEEYLQLKQVIFLGILDFKLFDGDNVITRHILINQSTGEHNLRDFDFNFIELPKFNKSESNLDTEMDYWLDFFKSVYKKEGPPQKLPPSLNEAYEAANQYTWSPEEVDSYDSISMKMGVERNLARVAIEEATAKGMAEGEARGEARGEAATIARMVLTMQRKGKTWADICDATDLSLSDVSAILGIPLDIT